MTRSRSNQALAAIAGRTLVAIGLLGLGSAAAAQDAATRYAQMLAGADITARYNVTIEQRLKSQTDEIASLEQQIAGLEATAETVNPMLQKMFDQLQQFVASDVPFLSKERETRIERLRDIMASADSTTGEKYRRLLEAYTIEMEYGRTMDSYRETLSDGREAEFVRLGRVSLLYRTVDGQEAGYWDKDKKSFVASPEYKRAIELALRIAKQEGAPDLIEVPVPAPQGGRS